MAALSALLGQPTTPDQDILQAADKQLDGKTTDLATLRIKAIALLKLDRFDDAYRLFSNVGRPLQEHASLEYAYTCYKTRKPLDRHGDSRGHKHVKAQMEYNLETFEDAKKSYQSLLADGPASEQIELGINAAAVGAQLQWNGVDQAAVSEQDLTSHESYYNAACLSIAAGDLSLANAQLEKSKDLCRRTSELSQEEKDADLLFITLQQIHVLERIGQTEEAQELLLSVQSPGSSDELMNRMATLDSVVLDSASRHNPYKTAQSFTHELAPKNDASTFTFQDRVVAQNTKVAELLTGRNQRVKESQAQLLNSLTVPTCSPLSVLYAAAVANSQTGKKGIKSIKPLLERRPDDAGLVLLLVQMYAETGNLADAIHCLESFTQRQEENGSSEALKCRFQPALVALSVKLYEGRGQTDRVRSELAKAATYWRETSPDVSSEQLRNLYKSAGYALLGSTDQKEQRLAAEIFASLHKQSPDQYSTAGLVASNASQSATLSSDLDRLVSGINTDALLAAGIAQAPRSTKARTKTKSKTNTKSKPRPSTSRADPATKKRSADTTTTDATGSAGDRPTKRVKPSKQPKDYDPAKPADPERWLPLRERSTYRPAKGGKKKRDAARLRREMASQGTSGLAVPGATGSGGSSAGGSGAGGPSAETSRPGTPGVVGSSASGSGPGNKKKKAKGKR